MISHQTIASLGTAVPLLGAAGFVLGMVYFASLRRGVRLSVARGAWSRFVLSALARIALAALFFTFAVRWGAPALAAAFAGFLAARHLAVRAARRLA
jgi:F1F0 ATPase subunit 2